VKLLFDENLSSSFVKAIEAKYPGSAHVHTLGLQGRTDVAIWERAKRDGYVIVSKDNDFRQLSFLHGAPPKVIWLSVGNAGTEAILRFLLSKDADVQAFESEPSTSLLILSLPQTG
jgi:predicted nuclease of predicted toxin-antitoxin system